MRLRSLIAQGAALALLLAAGAAAAGDVTGSGILEDVDFDGRTVTVGRQTLSVANSSELLDGKGHSIALLELERSVGEWAYFQAVAKRPQPVLEKLQLGIEDANE